MRKYALNGNLLWSRTLNGTANGDDVANGVAVDSQDNVFACGVLRNNGTGDDFAVAKWDANGNLLWTRYLNGSLAGSSDRANALAVDNQDNVVAVGLLTNQRTMADFAVMRYGPTGTPATGWGTLAAPAPKLLRGDVSVGFDEAAPVAVDSSRQIAVAGESEWTHPTGDGLTNPNGDFTVMLWTKAATRSGAVRSASPAPCRITTGRKTSPSARKVTSSLPASSPIWGPSGTSA